MSPNSWPSYGIRAAKEKPGPDADTHFYVEGEGKTLYVDFPNQSISRFIGQLFELERKFPDNPEKQIEEAKQRVETFNEGLKNAEWDWLRFQVHDKRERHGHVYFGIRVIPDWSGFYEFLEELASTKQNEEGGAYSLENKYAYLMGSRDIALQLALKSGEEDINEFERKIERTQDSVESLVEDDVSRITTILDKFENELLTFKSELFTISQRVTVLETPFAFEYILEMISVVSNIRTLVKERGSIPPCYREIRKILENLCWVVFHDLLVSNANYYHYFKENQNVLGGPAPYRHLSQEWYQWDSSTLQVYDNITNDLHKLRNRIHGHLQETGYPIHKGEVTVAIRDMMSYPLFLALTGTSEAEQKVTEDGVDEFLRPWSGTELMPMVEQTLQVILQEVKGKQLYKKDRRFVEDTAEKLTCIDAGAVLVPAFPSNSFVIEYVDRVFNQSQSDLTALYSEYSYFVHSYRSSWQIHPFSSVLEFKILRNELDWLFSALDEVLNQYIEHCYKVTIPE